MVKKIIIGVIISLVTLTPILAEVDIDASLSAILSANRVNEGDITSGGLAKGSLTVKSSGLKNVKSQLTLDFTSMRNIGVVSISKAWVKFRYPILRATLGKNRITWGDGAAFNAGDVIFDDYISPGGEEESLDLTADELKSLNRTMALVTFPLGRFTFAEVIFLPYDFFSIEDLGSYSQTGPVPSNPGFDKHSEGGRFVTKLLGNKVEAGYIYNGDSETHKPYVSFNGTVFLDYHLSGSVNIVNEKTDFDEWKESTKVSAGLFYLFDLENDKTLTLRLESLIKPYGDWETDALQLYPEIAFVPNEELALFVRSIINPLSNISETTFGLNWKTYQGFSIGSFTSYSYAESSDIDNVFSQSIVVTHNF